MKNLKKLSLILGTILLSSNAMAQTEFTAAGVELGQIDVFTNGNVLMIPAPGETWGAPSCPSVFFVQITPAVEGYSEILASALTARAAGFPVRFSGVCGSGTTANFFIADRIRLQ